ncbi:kinase-like domain-containing protein, partial [Gloeopeniophorella convolvens]
LRTQFLEGVAFLHENKIAHLDLNPSNVVVKVDGPLSARSLRLLIIDYGLSMFVEGEETLIDYWCGTRGWIAPEAGTEHGPDVEYSPILADRWACGRMIE